MILAFDTYYFEDKAKTVCIAFENGTDDQNYKTYTETLENVEEYRSGEFYKRELPCILSLFRKLQIENIETIVIDGFVFLDDNQKPGLGERLYKQLESKIPIVGVAKTNFATIEKNKRQLLRRKSKKPLYITAIGIDLDKATALIENMSGQNRIPTLLKTLDMLTKEKDCC